MAYYLEFDGVNDYVNYPSITLSGDYSITIKYKPTNIDPNADSMIMGSNGTTSWIGVFTGGVRVRPPDGQSDPIVLPTSNVEYTINVSRVGTLLTLEVEGVGNTTLTSSVDFTFTVFGRFSIANASFSMQGLLGTVDINGARFYDPSASNGTGSTLSNTIDGTGATDGTLVNFTLPDAWVWYSQFAIDPAQWTRRVEITDANVSPSLTGFTALITQANLPAEVFSRAEPSENYLDNPSGGNVRVNFPEITVGLNVGDYFEISLRGYDNTASNNSYRIIGQNGSVASLVEVPTYQISTRLDGGDNLAWGVTREPDNTDVVYRFEKTGVDTWEATYQGVPLGTRTSTGNFVFDQIFNIVSNSTKAFRGRVYYFKGSTNGGVSDTFNYDPSISNDTTLVCSVDPANNGTLVDFPTSGNYFKTANGGGDLRVCLNSDGTGQLPLEVVDFNTRTSTAVLWTRFPSFASGTSLWLFYDKPGETQPPVTDAFGRNAVWADYEVVSHDGGATDSSGKTTPVAVGAPIATDGFISGGTDYGGHYDDWYYNATVVDSDTFTMQAWAYVDVSPSGGNGRGVLSLVESSTKRVALAADNSPNDWGNWDNNNSWMRSGQTVEIGAWKHVSLTYDGTAIRKMTYEGVQAVSDLSVSTIASNKTTFQMGGSGSLTESWEGLLSEVRLSYSALPNDYIATEYNNQSSPATFWSTGTPENTTGGVGVLTVTPVNIGTTVTFYEPSVFKDKLIQLSPIASTVTTYSPSVLLDKVINLGNIGSTASVYSPNLLSDLVIDLEHVSSTVSLYNPSILKDKLIDLPLITSTALVHNLSILKDKLVTLQEISSVSITYEVQVNKGNPEIFLGPTHIPSSVTFGDLNILKDKLVLLQDINSTFSAYSPIVTGGARPPVTIYPAEGYGVHIRSAKEMLLLIAALEARVAELEAP